MSRQLALSAALSVLAMAAFALFQGSATTEHGSGSTISGAETVVAAPAPGQQLIALPRIVG